MKPVMDVAEGLDLSIVVPALNEAENVEPLVMQVERAVLAAGVAAELIVVDDGSTDDTLARLEALASTRPWLRLLHRPRPLGQSAAMGAGVRAARGRYVGFLDADLQNDPADLPRMLALLRREGADMVQGDRTARRCDPWLKRVSSWVGRTTRRLLLGDGTPDTGCSARVVRAELARAFPLELKGMHRFLPAFAHMRGARVVQMPVNHRPRLAGQTKYGVLNRGLAGLLDCLAMRWMMKRYRDTTCRAVTGEPAEPCPLLEGERA